MGSFSGTKDDFLSEGILLDSEAKGGVLKMNEAECWSLE